VSPYGLDKLYTEQLGALYQALHGLETVPLRYFNVFGPRQDPEGAYAAVIPKWIGQMLARQSVFINGDGETSRDFCYVQNAVQANLLAATTDTPAALNEVYNIAVSERTTLNELFALERALLAEHYSWVRDSAPQYRESRAGDVRHSLADISKAKRLLGYAPTHPVGEGMRETIHWFAKNLPRRPA
jgi:UDP-N-acetylglucosamine 4-epimerase